ncbi:MAG TPA: MFS transporter [Candidatus Elarobacter sp.]|jgi:DHA1 family tetracycline resistance protein-like MFS transporter
MILRLLPILGITFIDILGFSIMIPLLPFFVKRFGAPDIAVGIVFATFSVCQLIAGPVWGNVSDRIGRKMVLIISQIGSTVAWTMLAFAPSIGLVVVSRALEGFSGGNIGVTQAYVGDLVEPKRRGEAFAYLGASFSAGFVFGPAIGGWLADRYGFAVPFVVAALLQGFTLVVTIFMLPESRSAKTEEERGAVGLRDIVLSLGDRTIAPILWLRLIYTFALYGWYASMTLVLNAQLGWDVRQTSYVFAGFGVVNVLLQLLVVRRVVGKIGNRATTNLGLAFCVLAFALVPLAGSYAFAFGLLVAFATGGSFLNTAFPALASDASPDDRRGTVLGVLSGLDSLAGFVMPPLTTGILGAFGVPPLAALLFGLAVLALVLGLAEARRAASLAPVAAGAAGE